MENHESKGACCKPFKVLGVLNFLALSLREIKWEASRHVALDLTSSLRQSAVVLLKANQQVFSDGMSEQSASPWLGHPRSCTK